MRGSSTTPRTPMMLGTAAFLLLATSGQAQPSEAPKGPAAVVDAAKYDSLQEALDAVPEAGGIVRLPPGDFPLEQPVILSRENTRVVGSGAATHLINKNTQGKPAFVVRSMQQDRERKARLWRVQLADFRISGNPESGDGLQVEGANEIYIDGLSIDHNGGHGMNLIDCYEDPRIVNSIITYNGKAGMNVLGAHDMVVNANQFEENHDGLRYINGFNLCMTGNVLDDHLGDGVVIERTYGSVVSGNMIEECRGTAIILDRDCYGITLSSNVIAHNQKGGVDLRDAWGCAVSANTFTLIPKQAVRVGPNAGRIAITGNAFSNSYLGGKTKYHERHDTEWPNVTLGSGILLEGTSDIAITGNSFTGLQENAVQTVGECQRITITGNVAMDLGRSGSRKVPAFDVQNVRGLVRGNNAVDD